MDDSRPLGRTMKAAHQLALAGGSELAVAGELLEVYTTDGRPLSLVGRRTFLLMCAAAAGDAWNDRIFKITKSDIRGSHRGVEPLDRAIDDVSRLQIRAPGVSGRGRPARDRINVFSRVRDENDDMSSAWVEFRFSSEARELLAASDIYARLTRSAVVKFRSVYSLRLYELGCLLMRRRDSSISLEVGELREKLQVPPETYTNFKDLRRRVLEQAKKELDHLAPFDFSWEERTVTPRSRVIQSVRLRFPPKQPMAALLAMEETERHSAGRAARREGTVEEIVDPGNVVALPQAAKPLPETDGVELQWPRDDDVTDYDPRTAELYRLAVGKGGGHAVSRLAAAYVQQMGERRFALSGERLRKSWAGFVESKAKAWQPV